MGLILYRKGSTHTVKGILCELKVVDPNLFTGDVEKGWHLSVYDIGGKKKSISISKIEIALNLEQHMIKAKQTREKNGGSVNKSVEIIKPEIVKILEPVKIDINKLSNKKLREIAQANKITDFKTARIETLKGKLTACQEQATLKAS